MTRRVFVDLDARTASPSYLLSRVGEYGSLVIARSIINERLSVLRQEIVRYNGLLSCPSCSKKYGSWQEVHMCLSRHERFWSVSP